jgi:hypothetical protein
VVACFGSGSRDTLTRNYEADGRSGLAHQSNERRLCNLRLVREESFPASQRGFLEEETGKTKTILIQRDFIEPLGEIPLVNFDKFSLQTPPEQVGDNPVQG